MGPEQLLRTFQSQLRENQSAQNYPQGPTQRLLLCTPLSLVHPVPNSLFTVPQTYSYLRAFARVLIPLEVSSPNTHVACFQVSVSAVLKCQLGEAVPHHPI